MTTAETKAPLPDEVEDAIRELAYFDRAEEITTIRAHIAALEAENKRLLDALAYIANTDPDDGGSREFPDYVGSLEVCHEKAREALSSHKTQEVIGKHPEPKKCVTCGGTGSSPYPFMTDGAYCHDCKGSGKAGA